MRQALGRPVVVAAVVAALLCPTLALRPAGGKGKGSGEAHSKLFDIKTSARDQDESDSAMWGSADATPCSAECKARLPPLGGGAYAERLLHFAEMAITGMLFDEAGNMNSACGSKPNPENCFRQKLPYNEGARLRGDDWPAVSHTMVGTWRLRNFREAVESVVADGIEGDVAELGVWKGGASIFARMVVEAYNEGAKRRSLIFDAFESIPGYGFASPYLAVSEAQVRKNFAKYGAYDENQTRFYKGFFNESVPAFRASEPDAQKIAVLRVDGNFYSSYQDAFYALYELVPRGGIVILDDVGSHAAVQLFWSHFTRDYGLPEKLHPVGLHTAWFRKRKAVRIDRSKYRPVKLPETSTATVTFVGQSEPASNAELPPPPTKRWGTWATA